MAYKNRRYNGVMTKTGSATDVVTTLDTSVIGSNKVFSVDVLCVIVVMLSHIVLVAYNYI